MRDQVKRRNSGRAAHHTLTSDDEPSLCPRPLRQPRELSHCLSWRHPAAAGYPSPPGREGPQGHSLWSISGLNFCTALWLPCPARDWQDTRTGGWGGWWARGSSLRAEKGTPVSFSPKGSDSTAPCSSPWVLDLGPKGAFISEVETMIKLFWVKSVCLLASVRIRYCPQDFLHGGGAASQGTR